MCKIRILTLTTFFTPKGQMGKFLRGHLLAMDVSCDIYEKFRGAICRSLDIAIHVCTIRSADLTSQGHPRSRVKVKSERAGMVSY